MHLLLAQASSPSGFIQFPCLLPSSGHCSAPSLTCGFHSSQRTGCRNLLYLRSWSYQ